MELKDYIEPRMLIDGKLVDAQSGKTFEVVNPATEEVIGSCANGSVEDASLAIEAARRAFDETDWATNAAFRKTCLQQLQKGLNEEREDIRALSIAEAGAPFLLTFSVHTDTAINDLSWFIEQTESFEYEVDLGIADTFGGKSRRVILKEPVGVVAAITPWNFPLWLNLNKLAPALAMGNTIVLKPAPDTPFSATVIGRIVAEKTDIPPGVVNIITSSDHLVGEALVGDPRVDMVTFTGSTATGKKIMAKAAETVKKVHLELGGKSAAIILDDADLATAVPAAAGMVCAHAGQGCVLTTRMLVPRACYEEAVQLAKTTYDQLAYGDP
ncbi:MAG: aldehyde dehydrogenase family protein, partial [Acidimicrobiia bacterium]